MKSIEFIVVEKYLNQRELPSHKQIPAQNYIDWAQIGAREAQRWFSVNEELPDNLTDVLVKLSNGKIAIGCLYDTGKWGYSGYTEDSKEDITHWRPIQRQ